MRGESSSGWSPTTTLMAEAEKLARTSGQRTDTRVRRHQETPARESNAELEDQLDAETSAIVSMTTTSDGREGVTAFREKRRAELQGSLIGAAAKPLLYSIGHAAKLKPGSHTGCICRAFRASP